MTWRYLSREEKSSSFSLFIIHLYMDKIFKKEKRKKKKKKESVT
jgi:hypothetical protein